MRRGAGEGLVWDALRVEASSDQREHVYESLNTSARCRSSRSGAISTITALSFALPAGALGATRRLGNLNAMRHLRARRAAVDPAHNVMRRFSPRESS
jgi:hypothetical protein